MQPVLRYRVEAARLLIEIGLTAAKTDELKG